MCAESGGSLPQLHASQRCVACKIGGLDRERILGTFCSGTNKLEKLESDREESGPAYAASSL